MTTAIFCGSRDWTDRARIAAGIAWARSQGVTEIAHGDCRGADRIAAECAAAAGLAVRAFPADWSRGRRAGPERNQRMLDEARPALVVAFRLPDSRGTDDMVRRARAAGVRTVVVEGRR